MNLYLKLAFSNIKNNKRSYFPYILSSILSVGMFYILHMISMNEKIGANTKALLLLTVVVSIVFSGIFLFYTNSFLFKQRKKEFGLYQVLGMGKNNLSQLILWESLIVSIVSIFVGLIVGILFGKFIFVILLRLIGLGVDLIFTIEVESIKFTLTIFSIIFAFILVWNVFQTRIVNVIDLILGEKKGEKEPKANWVMSIIGFIFLGVGYAIVQIVQSPINALPTFIIAVLLVMFATYLIFISGTIVILKILKLNKKIYYKRKNFLALSTLIYRMKQNAVGLANICIMSTGVLVLISTTFSLYIGMNESINNRFPKDFSIVYGGVNKYYDGEIENLDEKLNEIRLIVKDEIEKNNLKIIDPIEYNYAEIGTTLNKNVFRFENFIDTKNFYVTKIIPLSDYNRMQKTNFKLNEDEILIYVLDEKFSHDEINFNGKNFKVKKVLDDSEVFRFINVDPYLTFHKKIYLIAENMDLINEITKNHENRIMNYFLNFDVEGKDNDAIINAYNHMGSRLPNVLIDNKQIFAEAVYSLYGVFLFIGVFIGLLLIMATTLVIYYKQISEGFDDKERYQILQKVGMSHKEVKSTIRRQVLIVFFVPLVMAFIHMAFAFRVINKLLFLLNFSNTKLFLTCVILVLIVFSIFYAFVFGITSKEYYKIIK